MQNAKDQTPPSVLAAGKQRSPLLGSVSLATPPAFRLLGCLAVVLLFSSLLILGFSPYTERVEVGGKLLTESGLIILSARAAGRVTSLPLRLSSDVKRDDVVAELDVEDESRAAGTTGDALLKSLRLEQEAIEASVRLGWSEVAKKAEDARMASVTQQRLIKSIGEQIELQKLQVETFESLEARSAPLVEKGYVTRTEYEQQKAATVSARIRLADLAKERIGAEKQLADIAIELQAERMSATRFEAESRQAVEKVAQQMVANAAGESQVYRSPVKGLIATVAVRRGQYVAVGAPLMTILPSSEPVQATIQVPSRLIGKLKIGQSARVQLDAYPYQQFGAFDGIVTQISQAPMVEATAGAPVGERQTMFDVTVSMTDFESKARASGVRLVAGMTVRVLVDVGRRSLWHWLLFGPSRVA